MYPFDYPFRQGCLKRACSSVNLLDCLVVAICGHRTIFHLPCQSDGIEFINIILQEQPRTDELSPSIVKKGTRPESL
jgi:hypothetical protein